MFSPLPALRGLALLAYIFDAMMPTAHGTISESLDVEPPTPQPDASSSSLSAVLIARGLQVPESNAVTGGEAEHAEWWDAHDDVIRRARNEYGRKNPDMYRWTPPFLALNLEPNLREAFAARNVTMLREFVHPTPVDNVYTLQLFQPGFVEALLAELDHHDASGIPRRRPNGMNRYGAALNDLGFDEVMGGLVSDILSPLARTLFPRYVGPSDVTHHYPFTVRYRPGEDVELSEHADASVITVNVCLEAAVDEQVLYFKEHRTLHRPQVATFPRTSASESNGTNLKFVELSRPGQAVIHLGQIVHGVAPIAQSRRSNLVVWLFADHGDVRVAEYSDSETALHERQMGAFWDRSDDSLWDEL